MMPALQLGQLGRAGVAAAAATALDIGDVTLLLHGDEAPLVDSSLAPIALTLQGGIARAGQAGAFAGFAIAFDGSNDFITAGSAANWKFLHDKTAAYTLEARVWPTNYSAQRALFATCTSSTSTVGIIMGISTGRQIYMDIMRGAISSFVLTGVFSGVIPDDGAPHHIMVTVDPVGGLAQCWIDGADAGDLSFTANPASATDPTYTLAIGAAGGGTGNLLLGNAEEFCIRQAIAQAAAFTPPALPYHAV